jgi:hypothetical protein
MSELRNAQWVLNALENGTSNSAEIYKTAATLDPVCIHFIFRYMREKFSPDHPAASGVQERMVNLTSTYDDLVKMSKKGEKDPIREWFDDTYRVREYLSRPNELLEMIVEKIEG